MAAPTSSRLTSGDGSAATTSCGVMSTLRAIPSISWSVRKTRCFVPNVVRCGENRECCAG